MLEYDMDSLVRKWRGCIGAALTPTGMKQVMYANFDTLSDGQYIAYIGKEKQPKCLVSDTDPKEKEYKYQPIKIVYHAFESGWYPSAKNSSSLLTKKHVKHFNVGINSHSHRWVTRSNLNGQEVPFGLEDANYLGQVEVMQYNSDLEFGILSKQLWWYRDTLYFLGRQIGLFKNNILSIEQETLLPYIKPLVGAKCQIELW
jgi:hypothetical protein